MAENLVAKTVEARHPWWPNLSSKYRDQNFIYLKTLQEDNPKLFYAADARFRDSLGNLNFDLNLQLDDLYNLALREQEKEDRMLDDFFGVINGTPREDGARIQAFNDIYQHKGVFERNLKKIRAIAEEKSNQRRIDITANFKGYLVKRLGLFLESHSLEDLTKDNLMEISKEALMDAFYSVDEIDSKGSQEEKRAYQELVEIVQKMEKNEPFVERVFDLYLGNTLDKLEEEIKNNGAIVSKKNSRATAKRLITGSRTVHGDLLEEVSALIISTLASTSSHGAKVLTTGKTKQKADIITFFQAQFEMPTNLLENAGKGSVREQFIKKFEKFYSKLEEQSGYIIEVSAKNYNLTTEDFTKKGFAAQGATSIKNFEKMLKAYRYDPKRINDLVFALTNIGPDTLQSAEQMEIVTHSISLLIGYFLFDDIDMDINTKAKAIHLFNLDGIYVPLSSFLFAAYDTLQNLEGLSQDMVHVSYEPKSIDYQKSQEGDWLTRQKWFDMAEKKQNQESISIHFFKDFPKYIAERLK